MGEGEEKGGFQRSAWKPRRTRLGLDDNFQDKVSIVINGTAGKFECSVRGIKTFETVCHHVVQTGESEAGGPVVLRAEHANASRIGIRIAENAQNVNFPEMSN